MPLPRIELPQELKQPLKDAIERSDRLDEFLTRAALSGRDVGFLKDKNAADKKELTSIKQAFFPND